jgi:hypothetical protein
LVSANPLWFVLNLEQGWNHQKGKLYGTSQLPHALRLMRMATGSGTVDWGVNTPGVCRIWHGSA